MRSQAAKPARCAQTIPLAVNYLQDKSTFLGHPLFKEPTDGWTNRPKEGPRDGPTDKWTDRWTVEATYKTANKQANKLTNIYTIFC